MHRILSAKTESKKFPFKKERSSRHRLGVPYSGILNDIAILKIFVFFRRRKQTASQQQSIRSDPIGCFVF